MNESNKNAHIEHIMKKISDEMPGGFFIYQADEDQELIYVNQAMLQIFGCKTREEFKALTHNSFKGIVHPDDLEKVQKSIQEQVSRSQYDLDYVEYRIIRKDGSIRWLEDYGHFVSNPSDGDVFYVFASDATDKKEREMAEKIASDQEYLRRIEVIETLSIDYDSILYVNLDTNKVIPYRLSGRIERLFGKETKERDYSQFIYDYIRIWVCPEDCNLVYRAVAPRYIRQKLTDKKTYYINYRVLDEGATRYLQFRIVNTGTKNHISRIVIGCRSVDEEIRHEMTQKRLVEDALNHARLANIARNTFLSNMSHDMRTPLNAITGYTALAKSSTGNPKKLQSYLDKINTSSEQLLQLITDVLELSRLESGKVPVKETPCNLCDILEHVYKDALLPAERKDITVTLKLGGLKSPDVFTDWEKLFQIFSSLTNNAVKYTSVGGSVEITAAEQKISSDGLAVYEFVVEDNGIGISEEFQAHIFEPFEREKNTTLSGVSGTGLGLTIAKNLVDILGGTIALSSTVGVGSRFTVTLTLRVQDKPFSSVPANQKTAIRPEEIRILLVEDNELNLEIEVELLQEMGFPVDTAENGSIAVDKIKNSRPGDYTIVLMDIQMPVMNGYEAARAIRGLENSVLSGIPIIAVSSNAFEEDRRLSRKSGMNAHVAKPVNYTKLLDIIEEMISCDNPLSWIE